MPPRRRTQLAAVPSWVEDVTRGDPCLWEAVVEACVARYSAAHAGASASTSVDYRSGDAILDEIRVGRVVGTAACRRAAVAVRKYTQAHQRTAEARDRTRARRRPRSR